MITAIANLLLLALGVTFTVFWIIALADSDGECHYEDCGHCPYTGECPWEERKKHEADS